MNTKKFLTAICFGCVLLSFTSVQGGTRENDGPSKSNGEGFAMHCKYGDADDFEGRTPCGTPRKSDKFALLQGEKRRVGSLGSAVKNRRTKEFDPKRPTAQKYGSVRIRVRQITPRGSIAGTPVPRARVPELAERFFRAINKLPESFISRSGLKYVTFVTALQLNNAPAAGVASGDTIYLAADCSAHTIYHELYHIFDPPGKNKQWLKLNPGGFVYTGSAFYQERLSKFKRKKMNVNLEDGRFKEDFVSRYAMSNEREDRAETFAAMIVEGEKFLRRTEKSPVMKKKMEYIIDATDRRNLLGRDFWNRRFRPEAKK